MIDPQLKITNSQVIKALAILMVVLSHFRKLYELPDGIQNIFNPGGYLGVGLFLMLSGYGCAVSASKNDLHTFIRRVIRVVVPLTSVTILTIVAMSITKMPPPKKSDISCSPMSRIRAFRM